MRIRKFPNRVTWLVGLLTAMIGAGMAMAPVASAGTNPPGNNGTVKIHEVVLDSDEYNQPHVDCPFTVAFFGFDEGDVATVTFISWSPNTKGQELLTDTVDIGADDNSGGGSSDGFDGEKSYELDFDGIEAEQQGFHVKLTVEVTSPDSKTPKFNKYKVFWTQPCEEQGGPTTTTMGGPTTTTMGGPTTTMGGPTTTMGGGGRGGAGAAAGQQLPFTGSNSLPVVITGLLLLVVGAGGVLASRRLRTR